ncbi:polysaccharide biosynthesis/export family protein [Muricoccus pecuniae]|uniref:Protein involved in polysaccharide export with SLBB domain n=1 Tax=Muricoccus pecuniae TaxID=693023 RepID=A0A840Y420_9PROT|nr:SLBB domain-containing protein [Roseomonas pecuniae]MBB5694906.1 protein involved in polysaccharide export with SLBB domain [Roseomonas pecuniae]
MWKKGGFALAVLAALTPILPSAALAQGQPLLPPSLPSTLPGGMPLPSLAPGAQGDILQRIIDAAGGRMAGGTPSSLPATPHPPAYAAPPAAPASASALALHVEPGEPLSNTEAFFAARLPDQQPPLRQFGYDTFRNLGPPQGPASAVVGALPDDYRIGRDDEVIVSIRGRSRQSLSLRIGRDGMLTLPDLAPFPAAGRTLRELRADIEMRVARELGGSEAFVSIGQTRQIAVFVAGEVVRPGLVPLPALASLLDALGAAGGIRRTGSLRAVRVEGPGGARVVDLYAAIAGVSGTPDLSLREGERVVVPPLGGVVALGGDVTRPGIYELPAGVASAPLASVLALAGGALRPAGNRFLSTGTDAGGRRAMSELSPGSLLRRGDAVTVSPGVDVASGGLRLAGHVAAPVIRGVGPRGAGLRALLADPRVIRPDPYVRMGVAWRMDERTRVRRFIAFDLGRVMTGGAELPLREGDEVILLSQSDVLWLASPAVQRALRGEAAAPLPVAPAAVAAGAAGQPAGPLPGSVPPPVDCPALMALAVAARSSPLRFAHARSAGFPDIGAPGCPQVFVDYPALLPFLLDQSVLLAGEVRLPGLYPVIEDTGLDMVIAAAGGPADTADLSAVEFAREPLEGAGAIPLSRTRLDLRSRNFAAVRLSPRDAVRIPRGFGDRDTGPVTLVGEFLRPGTYDIRRGERLSELLARAGGLTGQAYPYGAVFTRESVRQRQQEGFQRTARELESSLIQVAAGQAVAGSRQGGLDLGGAINAGQALAGTLREARAAGRMVVEANPVVLAARPELDVLLEPGDLLVIPKRPNEVTVVGAVLNPGSLQFSTGWKASQYVRAAGGEQRFADASRAFVVLPNGQSVPAGLGSWQSGGPPIPPGSLVVVPQDPSPYETWGFIRDLTSVLGQISISSAALAVISKQAR